MPVLIIACVLIAVILVASVKIIGQAEVMVVERLGRFNRIARSGLNLLVPFIERPRSIDVRAIREHDARAGVREHVRDLVGAQVMIDWRDPQPRAHRAEHALDGLGAIADERGDLRVHRLELRALGEGRGA